MGEGGKSNCGVRSVRVCGTMDHLRALKRMLRSCNELLALLLGLVREMRRGGMKSRSWGSKRMCLRRTARLWCRIVATGCVRWTLGIKSQARFRSLVLLVLSKAIWNILVPMV